MQAVLTVLLEACRGITHTNPRGPALGALPQACPASTRQLCPHTPLAPPSQPPTAPAALPKRPPGLPAPAAAAPPLTARGRLPPAPQGAGDGSERAGAAAAPHGPGAAPHGPAAAPHRRRRPSTAPGPAPLPAPCSPSPAATEAARRRSAARPVRPPPSLVKSRLSLCGAAAGGY